MISRFLNCSLNESVPIWKKMKLVSILCEQNVFVVIQVCTGVILTKLSFMQLSCFLKSKSISLVKFEDVEVIKGNVITKPYSIPKEEFQRFFIQWKTHRNKCIEYQEYKCIEYLELRRKWMFHSLFISLLIDTDLVLIIFWGTLILSVLIFKGTILKKIKVSYTVHFDLGRYNLNIDSFWTQFDLTPWET